jgi:hypothetical protein
VIGRGARYTIIPYTVGSDPSHPSHPIQFISQLFGEIADSFPSSLEVGLPTPLIHFPGCSVLVCRPCILFSTWVAAPLRSTGLFFFVRTVVCESLTCLSYHSQAPIYSNMLNIVTFWFSDSPASSTRISPTYPLSLSARRLEVYLAVPTQPIIQRTCHPWQVRADHF